MTRLQLRHIIVAATFVFACDACNQSSTQSGDQSAGPAAAETYNLRGAPVMGASRRVEFDLTMTDAQTKIKADILSVSGLANFHLQSSDELEILEIDGGQVRKGRLNHLLNKSTMQARITMSDDEVDTQNLDGSGPLRGRAEMIEYADGRWTRALEGAAATPQQARLLADPPVDEAMYPTAIKVGESWTQNGPETRRWLAADFTSITGEIKNTLLAVEVQQGEKVAVIEAVGEVHGTMLDDSNRKTEVSLGIHGTVRRSLDRAVDLEATSQGPIKLLIEVVADDITMKIDADGRYTARIIGTLR